MSDISNHTPQAEEPKVEATEAVRAEPTLTCANFDVLGYMSLFLGVLSILIMPAMPDRFMAWPIAFSIAAAVLGFIRLEDKRCPTRSDAAIAGVVCGLISMVILCSCVLSDTIKEGIDARHDETAAAVSDAGKDEAKADSRSRYDDRPSRREGLTHDEYDWGDLGIRQVPIEKDEWEPRQVPLSDPSEGTTHGATIG